jgi:hypothetical protein
MRAPVRAPLQELLDEQDALDETLDDLYFQFCEFVAVVAGTAPPTVPGLTRRSGRNTTEHINFGLDDAGIPVYSSCPPLEIGTLFEHGGRSNA